MTTLEFQESETNRRENLKRLMEAGKGELLATILGTQAILLREQASGESTAGLARSIETALDFAPFTLERPPEEALPAEADIMRAFLKSIMMNASPEFLRYLRSALANPDCVDRSTGDRVLSESTRQKLSKLTSVALEDRLLAVKPPPNARQH